ncbi:amidohydrolase family protein [Pseudactinotalea suaedae]|uniref:amidohydrolase family protein n=1 Tax=Pseudactinotalea suaedae TaxID=1524924 RepID=UPI0012E31704|nr:amidohydrolase family protein [Pseudactinotalea suaedae]
MIDAHLHTWDRARSRYAWLDGAPAQLQADHSLDQGFAALTPFGVERAVLVQADETLAETAYLLELVAVDARLAGAVVYLPLEDPGTVAAQLATLAEDPGFVGVRNLTHDRPDPDWVLGAEERRSIGLIEAAGVPLDYVAVLPRHLENLVTLAREHADLTFVLDHLGTAPVGLPDDDWSRWQGQLAEIAALPNVVAKVSGIYRRDVAEAAVTPEQMEAVLGAALAAFGADRLLLGSDWPVCTIFSGAEATMRALVDAVAALPAAQAQALRSGTATRIYGLAE